MNGGSGKNRPAQFMAYRALKGYEEMVEEMCREKEERIRLSEEEIGILSGKLSSLRPGDAVSVRFYRKDAYASVEGEVRSCDGIEQTLTVGKTVIPFRDLLDLRRKKARKEPF